jgi:DNA-binding NarL/FixJ family response regulator
MAPGRNSERITVMVVDDHPVVRHGIASLLESEEDIEVVAQARSGEEAVRLHAEHGPAVTIMDLRLPGMSGVDAIRRIRAASPDALVVVLTTYDGDEDIHQALEAGARAYLLKDSFTEEVVETVRAVHGGARRVPEAIARRLAERPPLSDLSPRELEVLRLVARGMTNKDIADELGIAEGTVKIHVTRLLGKLGVDDRTAAVMIALQRGIIRF